MSISSSFLWRFLDDVWDLLPTEDRELFHAYWKGQLQIGAGIEHGVIEAAQGTLISGVPTFATQRWNRFQMTEDFCDLFTQTDQLTLVLDASSTLSRETAFFETISVSVPSGKIYHEETIRFFDNSVRQLRYGNILNGMFAVTLGTMEFTAGRDYTVNLATGQISPLDDGRIPPTELLTVRYWHATYTLDLDYTVDTVRNAIARSPSTAIADGADVVVTYTYNGTVTVPLESATGRVAIETLIDLEQDFSGLLPDRVLTITAGPNAGTYNINAVLSPTMLQVTSPFPVVQTGGVTYTINAFPHGIRVDAAIASIPLLQDLIDNPTSVLVENVDYRVVGGVLGVRAAFLRSTIGPEARRTHQAWAEVTKLNLETPYRNFGVLIDFFRENSEAYKLALQGLWYTFWTGSTPNNLQRGLHILLGLPFAKRDGTVTRIDVVGAAIDVTSVNGQVLTYSIPAGLVAAVAVGAAVKRFDSLTNGVQIIDRNNEPGFVTNRLGREGIAKFLTSNATRGLGNSDETRALTLLENHLFMPQVLVEAITAAVNITELTTFLDNMKPAWTEYVLSLASEASEVVDVSETLFPPEIQIDLSTTISNNQWNQSFQFNNFLVQRGTGLILAGGTQATGNFQDSGVDFAALGVDRFDVVRIASGIFRGYHQVLKRITASILSLDIPDALIVTAIDLDYVVIPSERSMDNDMINLRREHVVLPGSTFSAPAVLNTKSDVDLAGTTLSEDEIKALLLVDVGHAGFEVQAITAANLTVSEITVATPPGVVVRDHELCSCALTRTNNAGPTVTDAFAI